MVNGVWSIKNYPVRPCTEEDYSQFYPVSSSHAIRVENFKKLGLWKCLDWKQQNFSIFGNYRSDDSSAAIEPSLFPCASQLEMYDGTVQGGSIDCEWDELKVREYLGSALSLLVWYNQSEFDSTSYGEERVIKSSELFSKQTDISQGQFTETFLELH